ncbi:MAG TPA: carboxypeptidase-like regulatory domain-containing protein, partial [Acidimicrobiales bacterium]|nr:carboxypeptidase-like regulatory domain-containing protein [Acidimicrobiales bacterium]
MQHATRKVAGAAVAVAMGATSFAVVSSPAEAAPPTRIAGTVTAAGGAALAGVKVTALKLGGTGQWAEADNAVTGVDGSYQIGKFDSGTYRIRFDDPSGSYETEFYDNQPRVDLAQDIVLKSGGGRLENVDAELGAAARFTGRVLDSSSAGIAGATVTAYVRQEADWVEFQVATTAADGSYDLGGLPGGVYTLGFFDPASGITEYWNDKAALADADSLSVTNDGTTSGLDAQLATPQPEPEPEPEPEPSPTPTPTETPTPTTPTPTSTATSTSTATPTAPAAAAPTAVRVVSVV